MRFRNRKNSSYSFLGNSVFIFLNRFFNNIASLLVMFFYAHQLAKTDYGHYQAFWAQLNVFNALAGLGISIFALTYSPEKIRALLKRINPKFYLVYLVFLIVCGLLFGWLQTENHLSFPWPVLFLSAFALCNISDTFLIVFRKFNSLAIINLLYAAGFFGIHYAFISTPFRFNSLLAWLLPLLLLKLIFSAGIILRNSKTQLPGTANPEKDFKGMALLWRQLYFYDLLQITSLWLDKFLISIFMNSKETATYINGTLNIPFLPIVFSALTGAALIHLSEKQKNEDRIQTVNYVGRVLSSVAFPIVLFLIFFRTQFIVFCFSEKYLTSVPIFLFAILIIPFRAYGHTILLQNMEKGKIINQGALLDVVIALILMYPLYLLLGLPGVALSFVFSTFFQVVFYGFQTKRLLHIPFGKLYPFKNWSIKAILFFIISAILFYGIPSEWSNTAKLLIGGGIMAVCSFSVLLWEMKREKKLAV